MTVAAVLWAGGCQSSPARADRPAPVSVAELTLDPARFDLTLDPPELLRDRGVRVQPLTGAALERASLSFEEVLAGLDVPDYIAEAGEAGPKADSEAGADGQASRDEPPSAAVRAYTLGRLAQQDGDRLEAIDKLEEAHRLDPQSAHILRVLGRAYISFGNEARGAQRLRQAVRLEGDDSESLFLLGRFAAQQGRWEEALVTLARSAEAEAEGETQAFDPAVAYLRPFYMAQGLLEMGHDAAAVSKMRQYLELPERFMRITRLHRELAFLDRQRARSHVSVGDALARLGRLGEALAHYEAAADSGQVDDRLLAARRAYLLLAVGHEASAQALVIDHLREGAASQRMLGLASYVAEKSPSREAFGERLRQVYIEADRPGQLAVAMADLLGDEAGIALLTDHLEHRPEHVHVFDDLLERLGEEDLQRAVAVAIALIDRQPDRADRLARALLEREVDPDDLLAQLAVLPAERSESAAGWYLRGAMYEAAGRIERALQAYDQSLEVDDTFASPHLANVELQIRLGRYDQALTMLDKVGPTDDGRVQRARARAYAGLERLDDAVEVLEAIIEGDGEEIEARLLLAELQMRQRDYRGAQQTLWAVLDVEPDNERAYEQLFAVHDENPAVDGMERQRLLRQAQQEIPESRIARLRMVLNWHMPRREFAESERILSELIEEDRTDYEALSRLIGVLGHTDRWGAAQELLLEQIDQLDADDADGDIIPLLLLEEVVKHTGETDTFYERMEAFLDKQEPTAETYLQLARLYDAEHLNRPEKAVEVLRKAIELEPDFANDLRLYLVQVLHRMDRPDEALAELAAAIEADPERAPDLYSYKAQIHHEHGRTEQAEGHLQRALELDPDHARANNDLAYYWAEQDRRLEQAKDMVRISVEAEPDNGAYLDTLGWIYYKLGRFEEAVEKLREARETPLGSDPVIVDHLGDALWRTGEQEEAVRQWRAAEREAERMIRDETGREEIHRVRDTARHKIDAARNDEPPPIATIPDEPEPEAGPDDAEPDEPPDSPDLPASD